jgi:hypothetical protein
MHNGGKHSGDKNFPAKAGDLNPQQQPILDVGSNLFFQQFDTLRGIRCVDLDYFAEFSERTFNEALNEVR